MKALHGVSFTLLVIGGINWLLIGLAGWFSAGSDWNIVGKIFGGAPWLLNLVYVLVGLSAVYLIATHKKTCKCCDKSMPSGAAM